MLKLAIKRSKGNERPSFHDTINRLGEICGTVEMDCEVFEESQEIELALVSLNEKGRFHALVLGWDGDQDTVGAERRGVADLERSVLSTSLQPGPSWSVIALG